MNFHRNLPSGISIIMIIRNGSLLIERFFSSFLRNNNHYPYEIIIVDDDDSFEVADELFRYRNMAHINYLKNNNYNTSSLYNIAAEQAVYPYLLFLHEAIIYTNDVIKQALGKLSDSTVGAVSIRLDGDSASLPPGKTPGVLHSGISFKWDEKEAFYRPVRIEHKNLVAASNLKNDFYPAVSGDFLLCRKADFDALGGFCEQYDNGFADIDFCLQLQTKLKKRCYCLNEISIQLSESTAQGKIDPEQKKRQEKHNNQVFKERMGKVSANLMQHYPEKTIKKDTVKKTEPVEKQHQRKLDTGEEEKQVKAPLAPAKAPGPTLRILYALPVTFDCNSGYHVQHVINYLKPHGVEAIVAIPGQNAQPDSNNSTLYNVNTFHDLLENGVCFSDGRGPDLIHAWTPREGVRQFVEKVTAKKPCPVIVHLEDNEEYLLEASLGRPYSEIEQLPPEQLDSLVPKNRYHPVKGKAFLKNAQAVTMVIDTLQKFNYANLPSFTIIPTADERLFYPRPLNFALRRKYNLADDQIVLVYTGNAHKGNRDEVLELYKAVELLNAKRSTVLLRTGNDSVNLGGIKDAHSFEINLGWVDRLEMGSIVAAADVLVQPGEPGPFNDYRVPCKLPEFFAIGRPVILPKTNIGLMVEHGKEAYLLEKANAENICDAVLNIMEDKELAGTLAAGGAAFYRSIISSSTLNKDLLSFYQSCRKEELVIN